jgi:hypothetical protein
MLTKKTKEVWNQILMNWQKMNLIKW